MCRCGNATTTSAGKYSIGAIMARLDRAGVTIVPMTRATHVEPGTLHVANIYSGRPWELEGVDSVVLACGAVPDDSLYRGLKPLAPVVHVLGDAYAPRRVVFATRQSWELARLLD